MSKLSVIIFPSLEILFLSLKKNSKRNKNILSGLFIPSLCPSSITPLNSHPSTVTKKIYLTLLELTLEQFLNP